MHAYFMDPLSGACCSPVGPMYTCVIAAAATHQPTPAPPPTLSAAPTVQLINHSTPNQHLTTNRQHRTVLPVSYGPPNPVYGGMEAVWHTEFQRLFSRYFATHSHVWFLSPNGPPSSPTTPQQPSPPLTLQMPQQPQYDTSGLGLIVTVGTQMSMGANQGVGDVIGGSLTPQQRWQTFLDSAKVRFCCQECGHGWTSMKGRVAFWFTFNASNGQGTLMFRLYGQKCQRCKSGNYENSMWYPEEVVKVLMNVYCHIGQFYYGLYQASITKSRRAGKPRTPHNSNLCQACQDGVCAERR
ncbi:hypothetical protein CHUAL_012686 [Chamberlinius hualienensis]